MFGDGVLVEANLELAPEVSHNANAGVVVSSGSWRASGSAFVRDADHLVTLVGASLYYRYQNVLSARALGGEATVAWESPTRRFAADGAATFQDVRNTSASGPFASFDGDRIPNRPFMTASASARCQLRGVGFGLTSRYVHGFFRSWESLGTTASKPRVPSQLVHGVVATYAHALDANQTLAVSAEVQNVTDEKVFDLFGVQRPGRAVFFKTSIEM